MTNIDQLQSENQQLQLAVKELKVLNDIATAISSIQPVDKIIDQIIFQCIKHLGVEEGMVSLLEQNADNDQFHTMIRRQDSSIEKVPHKLDNHLSGWMIKNRTTLSSNNIREDERFKSLNETSYSFDSILCVPLMIKGNLIGYLATFNKKNNQPFTPEDRRLLAIIASQSAQVIENARLYEEEKDLISLQEEMRLSYEIQLNLLPEKLPDIPGYQISAVSIPAKVVGGDYYDFISLRTKEIGFCMGDISGKGMPAAMLMANLQATFRSQGLIFKDSSKCLRGINNLLFNSTESTKFATFFYGILDPEKSQLRYANGGHDAPILFRKNTNPEFLQSTGLLLGVMADAEYFEEAITLRPGDLLVLYTDGITEAMSSNGKQYGIDRLIETVDINSGETAHQVKQNILEDVKKHTETTAQSDDITTMIIKKES